MYFQFRSHPGDLLRNTDVIKLPDPISEQETFWVWFHPCYQNSDDIFLLNRLYKVNEKEVDSEEERREFEKDFGILTEATIADEIKKLEAKITVDAFQNFYHLIHSGQIHILGGDVNA
ncbi:MAG: hypothetical protein KF685_09005 [Acidobacteria bacterium]|nr:hypothetical protein [Acidobacteriota bacterium]